MGFRGHARRHPAIPEFDAPDHEATILPIAIEIKADGVHEHASIGVGMPSPIALLSASQLDITLPDGPCILVEGPTVLALVVGLVQG